MLAVVLSLLAAAPAVKPIDPAELRGHIRFLASDLLEGRGPATQGDRLAQEYIAAQFEAMGLEPGAPDGGWVQRVEMVGVNGHPDTLTVKGLSLKFKDDFIVVSGHQEKTSTIDKAELVFVGFGITAPEYQWDDFKGVDLKGKVLVVMNSDPEDDPGLFGGRARLYYGRWGYKYEQARKVGAVGCLIIHTTPSAGYPWQVVQTSWTGEQFELPSSSGPQLQMKGWLTEAATRKLLALSGKDLDLLRVSANTRRFTPVPLGVTLSTSFTNVVARKTSGNVLGLLRGSDPTLKAEVVIYTAHHDHLGKKEGGAPGEDVIYNGAVDNASGVAGMLAIARYLSAQPKAPKRSVLFASVAAEEQGLLGSQYLVEHPPVPPGRMAANLNLDGLNIWGRTRDVSVIGLGKSSLDGLIVALAMQQGRTVKPDALSDRGFFYRSDQFNFAKVGVPSAYFSSGQDFIGRPETWGREQREKWEATHYHQPSDELTDTWDLSGAVEDVRLFLELGLSVANAPTAPTWTKGDEFESARKRALGGR
ncbi:MAG: M20/M25/M40 family metallo-hydrolase [Archangium sp.]|nr:M20/M25/M40 family metallo-hydrolase [Archangium sp.]